MSAQTIAADAVRGPTGYVEMDAEQVWTTLMALPEAVRLTLARALVKAEGWRVVQIPERDNYDKQDDGMSPLTTGMCYGWNECRLATLASEGGDGE